MFTKLSAAFVHEEKLEVSPLRFAPVEMTAF